MKWFRYRETDKSEMVGLMSGSNLEEVVSSEHLRNPKNAKNEHDVECAGGYWGAGNWCGGCVYIW